MIIEKAIIICIGDELLIGQTIDTNSIWMARQLEEAGISVIRKIVIADDTHAIMDALDKSIPEAGLILMTGGLGPTKDDITKITLNSYFGGQLVRDVKTHAHVKAFFEQRGRPMLPINDAQADVPNNCTILFNRIGTAPGMLFEHADTWIVSLPGVPLEMQTICTEALFPRLVQFSTSHSNIVHKHMLIYGRGESFVADDIADIESSLPPHLHLAYLPHNRELRLRLTGTGTDKLALSDEMDIYWEAIKTRERAYLISDTGQSMAEALVEKLRKNNLTMSTAESCTGGLVGSKVTEVPGASTVYMGSIVSYDNRIKHSILDVENTTLATVGAVSEATVRQMAESVRSLMQTDLAVSISGILGPTGGTEEKPVGLVYFGIASRHGSSAHKYLFHYDRHTNKEMAATTAIHLLFKEIDNLSG